MASPLCATDMLSSPSQYPCLAVVYGDNEHAHNQGRLKPALLGGCGKQACSSRPDSCSDVASFDSENEGSVIWQRSSALKVDEDVCCAASGSPLGMLQCEDALDEDDEDEDATREWAPGLPAAVLPGPAYCHADAEETLSNELSKEESLGPMTSCPLPPEYRGALVHWMRQVCDARVLSTSTFFSSVSVLDRFFRASGEGATPPSLLQLVALTSVAVAAKLEQQQCAGELLSLARDENGNLYKADDSRLMEIHMLESLEWRLRVPTIYTFTTLFLYRIINRPQDGQVVPLGMETQFRELVLRLAVSAPSGG
ncbi:hypothetical protein PLESTM_000907900 [Pleodorina starrii]|nr:hypothetical protein PLESTM_000907900 [Pleodorina starrii]